MHLLGMDGSEARRMKTLIDGPSRWAGACGRALVGTGLKLEIPTGFEGQVRPRSGLAAKSGITVLNAPGTIDSDYRGEVKVILFNTTDSDYSVKRGDRVAQLVFSQTFRAIFQASDDLTATQRAEGGFGSTGVV